MSRADKQQHQEHVVGTSRDTSVRLFAFANTRPGYQVVFAPEKPLIVLKSKNSATPLHPCLQWEPLSTLVFQARPNTTHAVYVADTTNLSSVATYDQEEHVNGAAVGPLLKRLSNAITRLNPHNATMVAAGVSGHLAMKYVLVGEKTLGHRDRLVQRLVLLCPTSLSALTAMTNAVVKRPAVGGYQLPEVVVLLKEQAEVPGWSAWLTALQDVHHRISSFRVTTDLGPSLFAAIVREAGLAEADGTVVDVQQRYAAPRVYRLDFVLSKQTKSVEQLPRLSPLDTLGYDDAAEDDGDEAHGRHHAHHHGHSHGHGAPHHHHRHDHAADEDDYEDAGSSDEESEFEEGADDAAAGDSAGAIESCCGCGSEGCGGDRVHGAEAAVSDSAGSMLVSGLHGLANWCDPVRVIVEGRVLDLGTGLVGTTDGCVEVTNLPAMIAADSTLTAWHARAASTGQRAKQRRPPAVAVAGVLSRDKEGRTTLRAEEARPLTKAEVLHSMTAGSSIEEIPVYYNTSRIAHGYGALLIRGRKCALVRNVGDAMAAHMYIPFAPHSRTEESCVDCAVRALCDACEVSSDNFFLPSYLPPVVYYPTAATASADHVGPRCVTIYTALAISPPPRGAASDAVEDAPEPEEPYDWVSFSRALALVETQAEREALQEAQRHLERAHKAGLYTPVKGCGLFGEGVKPHSGAAVGAVLPKATLNGIPSRAGQRLKTLSGIEFYVIVCPGGAAAELTPPLTQALHTSCSLVCGEDTTTSSIEDIAAEAQWRGERHVLLLLGGNDDAAAFCEAHLVYLKEKRQATAQVFTVLLPQTATSITELGGGVLASEVEARLDSLLSAVRVSDALITMVPPKELSRGEQAVLQVCCKANPDLMLFYSWEARHPFTVCDQTPSESGSASEAGAAPVLKEMKVRTRAGVPVAPAALAFLTHTGALDCFYAAGECRLLFAHGDVWVPTRGSTQGFVYLDVVSHCLAVEPGKEWASESDTDRTSELTLFVWCANDAAAGTAAVHAATLEKQLQWSEARDGTDWLLAYDPLPQWD
ncbi:conserved hypothetical protein [Leishmania major strain Friedlin]|uniref:Uncharacterized protein n=1 Tax=Leishmania major TaxID=5664 RepID=Q4Q502_LEIMA|nr:conserved hypothetical protein [Leishmania major strain Friedlin]CAG9580411.1 hypothetical_protein_-_conserved [Leishmania major strain Friedlin]CAJ08800.1 conserved hypothetical protein [Leishmania major strain Friedlin]|eukprot:XP_001685596.1 conserved hypothetical protein [Leishmania major strain Friedlin]